MNKILIGITGITALSAVAGLLVRAKRKPQQTVPVEPVEPNFEWISAEPTPEYEVNEKVMLWNPYLEDYAEYDLVDGPLIYAVEQIKYDKTDGCYRYKLKNADDWYAESWLIPIEYPTMVEWGEDGENDNGGGVSMRQPNDNKAREKEELARRKAWSKRADELLDLYNGHKAKGNLETADEIMEQYKYEQAIFNAGSAIFEAGGQLGGTREVN